MNFCMVTTFFPPYNFGGDGIFVYRLSNALARRGHTVHVIHDRDAYTLLAGREPETSYPLHDNVTVHSLGGERGGTLDLLASHQLGRPVGKREQLQALLNQDFDVIHFHNVSLLGGPAVLAYGNALKLCTTHDHWFVCAMHVMWRFNREACTRRTCLPCTLHGRRPPQLWRYTDTLTHHVQHVDAFIAPSEFARENHLRNGFPAPMHVLPNFVPEEEAEPEPFHHPRPYFLFAGRLEKLKGLQVAIEVFRHYHQADLLIAGTGTYERELRAQAAGLSHIHFLGFQDNRRLRSLYTHALAVIVPSICYETFGGVALEAFARRTPAVVHDLGALPEVVAGGGGLVYRDPAGLLEALELLQTRPDVRRQMAAAAYHTYQQNYTEARHIENYLALIEQVSRPIEMLKQ